jgi:hypothetical protein
MDGQSRHPDGRDIIIGIATLMITNLVSQGIPINQNLLAVGKVTNKLLKKGSLKRQVLISD